MATYILIHGGSRDGTIWDSVAALLRARGNQVYCPSLRPAEQSSLQDHIQEINNLIKEESISKVILVGHSYGALIITGIADTNPEIIEHLFFVDSIIPHNGKSLFDVIDDSGYKALEHFKLDPFKPFIEPILFDVNHFNLLPKTYIFCTQSEFVDVSRIAYNYVIANADKNNWSYHELKTSHSPMLTQPDNLVKMLLININLHDLEK